MGGAWLRSQLQHDLGRRLPEDLVRGPADADRLLIMARPFAAEIPDLASITPTPRNSRSAATRWPGGSRQIPTGHMRRQSGNGLSTTVARRWTSCGNSTPPLVSEWPAMAADITPTTGLQGIMAHHAHDPSNLDGRRHRKVSLNGRLAALSRDVHAVRDAIRDRAEPSADMATAGRRPAPAGTPELVDLHRMYHPTRSIHLAP
jgi:hypothetical protein